MVILHNCCLLSNNFFKFIYTPEYIRLYHKLLTSQNKEIQNIIITIITLISESSQDGCIVINQLNNTFIIISNLILNNKEKLSESMNILFLNYFNSLIKWNVFRSNEYVYNKLNIIYTNKLINHFINLGC